MEEMWFAGIWDEYEIVVEPLCGQFFDGIGDQVASHIKYQL